MVVARATGLVSIPDSLSSEEAAPILCAGIATFNALRRSGAQPGDAVAILGIGGLGHMALQYARKMGFRVIAIGRGTDIAEDVTALGAHLYLNTDKVDAASELQRMGGVQAIVATITNAATVSALFPGLAPHGRLVILGAGKDALSIAPRHLVAGERQVHGSLTGTPFECERTLDFSVLVDVRPRFQTMPLERAAEAYRLLKEGDVKFRMVLTMNPPAL